MDEQKSEVIEKRNVTLLDWGKDEMNLVELPLGPVTPMTAKTLEVSHTVYDPVLKRQVSRKTVITGSDAYGLPRPIDDQVLVGLKALTHEAGNVSPQVYFSRFQLCRILGWPTDGRSYRRLEESFNRLTGTMLQFKNAWFDKGRSEWVSKSFHLIDEVELCSRDRFDRKRVESGGDASKKLCYFVWNDVIFKSFQDGFIKTLDMELFRRIAGGKRREVPVRLFRILDKRLYKKCVVRMDLQRLAVGILGLSPSHCASQMKRIIQRAAQCLIECNFLERVRFEKDERGQASAVIFYRRQKGYRVTRFRKEPLGICPPPEQVPSSGQSGLSDWLAGESMAELASLEEQALAESYGSKLERRLIRDAKDQGERLENAGPLRLCYVRRYQSDLVNGVKQSDSA